MALSRGEVRVELGKIGLLLVPLFLVLPNLARGATCEGLCCRDQGLGPVHPLP